MDSSKKKGIFVYVFQMAESGELNKTDQSEIMNALISSARKWSEKFVNLLLPEVRFSA